jgi:hypothetical protein
MLSKKDERIVFLTPFHSGCSAVNEALEAGVIVEVFSETALHLCNYEGILRCYEDTGAEVPTYLLRIDGKFNAGENPYGYEDKADLHYQDLV